MENVSFGTRVPDIFGHFYSIGDTLVATMFMSYCKHLRLLVFSKLSFAFLLYNSSANVSLKNLTKGYKCVHKFSFLLIPQSFSAFSKCQF